ncbi:hypothetical protein [Borrelia hermsii]|uniref:Uncharacterized protein n=3 Tax=Borrelia hermsii TaxID=140 RepID=A0AAN1CEY0_BORHE|nr:hypothetical protein [Borrelia hermsii]AAX16980.1 hypothetical protein BH0469A [Borrelia hermsii DAH]AJW73273.1 hypothetical protein L283_02355 [Borrelia hermsii CC1]AMR75373.1 hypothetical protein A0V01_01960 [Borrelia hermsii]ANA43278.1 hypothetical protein AXX13_02360 [Borrelia hermsii HS1]UCP01485.1 hypothetical protein K9R62_02385 [Borrelia hermsii]
MNILYFILCSLINLALMFLVFFIEFLVIAKLNIIVSSVFQFILVFFMIIISIVVSYFVSNIFFKNIISKFFNLDK